MKLRDVPGFQALVSFLGDQDMDEYPTFADFSNVRAARPREGEDMEAHGIASGKKAWVYYTDFLPPGRAGEMVIASDFEEDLAGASIVHETLHLILASVVGLRFVAGWDYIDRELNFTGAYP